jgi:hypothetical protein
VLSKLGFLKEPRKLAVGVQWVRLKVAIQFQNQVSVLEIVQKGVCHPRANLFCVIEGEAVARVRQRLGRKRLIRL